MQAMYHGGILPSATFGQGLATSVLLLRGLCRPKLQL
jgi:hypothetical protein